MNHQHIAHTSDLYALKHHMEKNNQQQDEVSNKIDKNMYESSISKNMKSKKLSFFGVIRNALLGRPIPTDENPFVVESSDEKDKAKHFHVLSAAPVGGLRWLITEV